MSRSYFAFAAAAAVLAAGCASQQSDDTAKAVAAVDLPNVAPSAKPSIAHPKVDQVAPPEGIDVTKPPADATKTADGLVFKSLAEGPGPGPGKNDTVTIDYTGWHSNGATFFSTKTRGKPLTVPLANLSPGFVEAMTMMKKGGHAVFWLPPEIGYRPKMPPKTGEKPDTLTFEVTLVDIKPAPPIPADVAAPPKDAQKAGKGVSFVVLKPGDGKDKTRSFDTITFNYTGWDATGHMFDSTETRAQPRTTQPFHESAGMEEALTALVAGERARFWIPAELTKGASGSPQGQLCYEVEAVSVKPATKAPPPPPPDVAAPPKDAQKTAKGVFYKVLKPGDGKAHPSETDTVKVDYTGWTTDGRMFDTSILRGAPASMSLGAVIKGWTDGIALMSVGETTRFWIPVEMAYNHAPGKPDGMLVFDVTLDEISHGPPPGAKGHGPGGPMMPPMHGGVPGAPGPGGPPGLPPGHP